MKKKLQDSNLIKLKSSKSFGTKFYLILFTILFSLTASAQLSDFTLQVTKTDETCPGNGTLTFTSSNTTPGATINYKIFKLPNLVNEIANLSTNFLGGLSNGSYKIIATQSLSPNSNTQTQDIIILNNIVPIDFDLDDTPEICENDATITALLTSGTAVSYEIISGPVLRPLQPSNIFTGLPAGTYQVRVYDSCGQASVETRTIFTTTPQIAVSMAEFPDTQLPACDLITASHQITSSNNLLLYPINYQFTVFPPNGETPINISGSVNSGLPDENVIAQAIPFYHDQSYSYNLQVIDFCGTIYNVNNNIVNEKLSVLMGSGESECGQYFLNIAALKFRAPYTLTFLESPAGFNPSEFNLNFPNPYTSGEIAFGGEFQPVPMGTYTVQITDACNRTTTETVTFTFVPAFPSVSVTQTGGCDATTGNIKIEIPTYDIQIATIVSAPSAYPHNLPHDVSSFIIPDEGLDLTNIPAGTYNFLLYDTCGNQYTAEATIINSTNDDVGSNARPDCNLGKGTIRIRSLGSALDIVTMNTAPAGFSNALPYDVSAEISDSGTFTMSDLIPGNYTFSTTNVCGGTRSIAVTVTGYAETVNDFDLILHCGSFDFFFNHMSNGLASQSFWLQKWNSGTNNWEHPATGVSYPEGTIPSTENSMQLVNNSTTYNLPFTGDFRIIKRFETFENGSTSEFKNCIVTLHEFTFTGILEITGLESLTCNGAISDVRVVVNGVPPFIYKIIEKNGQPFFIDNANDNVFTNLEPAVYKFEVTDGCGLVRTYEFDVAMLPSLVVANQPGDYILCDDSSSDGIENFTLSSMDSIILGSQSPTNYSVTYYGSASDANSESNALSNIYSSGNQHIFARVNYQNNINCFAITDFSLEVKEYLTLNMSSQFGFCEGNNVIVTADSGYDSYNWSDGQTGNIATFDQPGIYTLTFTKEYGNVICEATHQIEITQSNAPAISEIIVTDWTDSQNAITVLLDSNGIGDYEYSLDNIHFQAENTFYGLQTGAYTVYVKDKNGCGPDAIEDVFLLTYPNFFTPNGDGINDFWRIKFSMMEPNMQVYIFDRYGKLITGFRANDPGWDGTLNGYALPSTDYWFLVLRENGKEHRGHFSMKR